MPKTIQSNQLTPGATYLVRGKVAFSRITRQTTDEERERENKRRMYPQDKNYTNMSIYDAQVLAKDPSNPTIEEKYAAECLYRSASQNYPGNNFSAMNKTQKLPAVGELQGNNQYVEIKPTSELATGLDVTLVMRVYKPTGQRNNGVSLDRVLINEPVRYYGGSNEVDNALKDFGYTFVAMPPQKQETADGVNTAAAEAAATDTNDSTNAFAPAGAFASATPTPAPAPAAQPAPQVNPQPAPQAAPVADNPFSAYSPANMQFEPGNARQY